MILSLHLIIVKFMKYNEDLEDLKDKNQKFFEDIFKDIETIRKNLKKTLEIQRNKTKLDTKKLRQD